MRLMHHIEKGVGMEEPVPAIKQHVLEVIDEQDVQGELFEGGEDLEA